MVPINDKMFFACYAFLHTYFTLQMLLFFSFLFTKKIQNDKMKLVYLPLLSVNNISFLQNLLFGLVPVYVSVKILYFQQVLEQKNTKQKIYAKSFKIV